jgi:predicted metal-dependent peptidase
MTKEFDLNKHVARLLMNEPFFAALSRRVDKKVGPIPTAGVRVNPETAQFEMLYNPKFFQGLTDVERSGVLKHEFYHLIFEHVTGRMPVQVKENPALGKKWNFATDLAINSHLRGQLPEGCLMPGEGPFADLPNGKSAEWYWANLPENPGKQGDEKSEPGDGEDEENNDSQGNDPGDDETEDNDTDGGGSGEGEESDDGEGAGGGSGNGVPEDGQLDDHAGWGDVPAAVNEMAKERLKDAVRKAAEEAAKAGNWGTVGSDTRQDITDRLLTTRVDWKNVLRYFIKTSQKANRRSTIKRINKRYPYIHPGRKQTRQAKIAVSIDQSGSVDNGMLQAFFAELNKLADLAEFTVIPFDTDVAEDKVFVWKKGEKRKWERVMCGGTCFDAPTKYVNKGQYDGHIVLTDMCAPKPVASKCQRMWMTTEYYAKNPYFKTNERVIGINT